MPIIFAIVASLITVPTPAARPEAECIKLYPGDWAKITDCVVPSIDLSKNPKLRDFFAACDAVRNAAQAKGATIKSATIVVHGVEQTCEFKSGRDNDGDQKGRPKGGPKGGPKGDGGN